MKQLHLIRKVIVISHPVRAVGTTVVSWIDLVPAARTVSRHSRCSLSAMHLRCSLRRRSTPGGVGKAQLQIIQIAVEERHAGPVYLREPFASPTIDGTEAPRPEDQATEDDEDDADRLGRDQFRDPQGDQQDAHLPGRFRQTLLVLFGPRRSLRDRRSNWDRRTTRRWRGCAVHDELLYGCLSLVTIEPLAASPLAALNRGWSCVLKTTSVPES